MTENGAYLRFPHLHRDLACFITEDDLWVTPLADEGAEPERAWRLTVDRNRVDHPRFSPDGRQIAFTTWRSLDPEVYVVPVAGGPPRRLTYWGSPDTKVCGWTPPDADGHSDVLTVASHDQPFSHFTWAYQVSIDGGPGQRLPWGPVAHIAMEHTGGEHRTLLLAGTPPHEPAAWKRYRGGATGRLWLQGERLLPDLRGHLDSPMFVRDRIAFLSDHEGIGNLYSCRPDGTDLRRHTDHDDFYARHAATDGHRVVYQCAGELWLAEDLSPAGRPRRLPVRLGGPRAGRRRYQVPATAHVDSLAVDHTGRASAVCVRGSLYWLTHRDGPARTLADTPGVRVRLPVMLGDTGRVAYVTDAEGEDALEIADLPRATRPQSPRRIAQGRIGRVREVVASPDGGTVAVASHDGRLLLVDVRRPEDADEPPEWARDTASRDSPSAIGGAEGPSGGAGREPVGATRYVPPDENADATANRAPAPEGGDDDSGTVDGDDHGGTGNDGGTGDDGTRDNAKGDARVTELIKSVNGPVHDLAFSPDSCWIAWAHRGIGRSLSQIKIGRLVGPRTIVDVTDGKFEDEQPAFTRDGRYLAFLSWRGFDPVYDVHTGDLSFPLGCRPYLVPLSSATLSPFALSPEGRPAAGGLDQQDSSVEFGTVLVEAEGLPDRVTPFPVAASKYSGLRPVRGGGLIWLRYPISGALGETFVNPSDTSGRPTLEHFDLVKAKHTELTGLIDSFSLSGDGSRLVVSDEGDLRVIPAYEPADADSMTFVDLRRIQHEADPAAEWRQAFDEAGRIIRAYFWDRNMCGIDWNAVLDQYRPLVERVATPGEFADLMREVLGELGTSHANVAAARRDEGPPHYQRPIGLLGADFTRTEAGEWQISRILPGNSSDSKARSPLAGLGIREGATVTHVDGRPVHPIVGPWAQLTAAGGTTVELTFSRTDPDRPPRRIAVVPLINDRPLRYQDWVARRREVVRELSHGKCGYLHIPDMGGSGWAQFNRDVRMEMARPALIVDVRGNVGGHISELVVEKLTRVILGWDVTRDAQPVSYASNAPRGPVVAVADGATSSDGDMIIAAFRLLGLGPVVGSRTWGGVVGMTGRHQLGDGTVITVPMNAAWFDEYGWSVENHGVDPDIEADRTPMDWAEGRHTVLRAAVQVALDRLERHPAASPPDLTDIPDRRRPPLPPRG